MIWVLAIPCQCVNFRKEHSFVHYSPPILGLSLFFESCKTLIKSWCNKIIGQYENIDCAKFTCLLIDLLTT
jgi:hypothetical protein